MSSATPLEEIRALQTRREFAQTIEPLRELLRENPKDAETNFLYGRALVATRQAELALFSLREAMRDPEWKERAGLEVAIASLITGDFNQAIEATTEILDENPEQVDALLFRAQARAHWRNDPTLALEDAERVLDLDPGRVEAYEPLILALLSLEQLSEAADRLAEAGRLVAATDADDAVLAWHCSTMAILFSDMGERDKAEKEFDACVQRFPGELNIVETSIDFFEKKDDYDRALEIMLAAVEANPDSRRFRAGFATRLVGAGRVEEAEAMLISATEVDTPLAAAGAWSDLGEFYHVNGRYEKAANAFGEAIERIDRNDPQLSFRYADALVLAREFDKALAQASKLDVEAHRVLIEARVAQERKDYQTALEGLLRAGQLWPDNPWVRYYTGLAAEQVGAFDRAVEEYRYSIRISAAATDSRTLAAKIIAAKGDPNGAYNTLFTQAIDYPLEAAGWILGANLIARVSNASQLQDHLFTVVQRFPKAYPDALLSAAEGLDAKGLPSGGVELLFQPPKLDWASDSSFPLVETLLHLAHKAEQLDRGQEFLVEFRTAGPDDAAIAEAEAILFELGGASAEAVRARWLTVKELDLNRSGPWVALGRLMLETHPERALENFERAVQLDPERDDLGDLRVRALLALERTDEAATLLEARLEKEPTDARAAIARTEIDLARNTVSDRTADWARRAVRFNRSVEDFERLATVYRAVGDEERAASAEKATQNIKDHEAEAEAAAAQKTSQS